MRKTILTMPISIITAAIMAMITLTLLFSIISFAQEDISADEKQLIAKLESGRATDADYKQIKENQLTKNVLEKADLYKLSSLDNVELNKKFKTKSIAINEKVDVKYKDEKLIHSKGDSISMSSLEGKDVIVTSDGFIIKKGEQKLMINGGVGEANIDKEGNVKVRDTTYKVGGQQGDVSIKRDPSDKEAVLTNAVSIETKGKSILNNDKGDMQIIQRENAFGVQSNGADVQVRNQIGKDNTAIASLKKGEKFYEIPTETGVRQGLTSGGKLDYSTPEKKYSLESNSHSFMDIDKSGKLEKVAAGYKSQSEVIASYTETRKDGSLISKTSIAGGDGFTIYKKAGLGWGSGDPGVKIENQEGGVGDNVNKFDVHERTFSGKNPQLTITTNGVNTYISPSKGIRAEKIGASLAGSSEKWIALQGKQVTISPDGSFNIKTNQFSTTTRSMAREDYMPPFKKTDTRYNQNDFRQKFTSIRDELIKKNPELTSSLKNLKVLPMDESVYNRLKKVGGVKKRKTDIDTMVIHYTAGSTSEGALSTWMYERPGVGAQILIEPNGDILPVMNLGDKTGHVRGTTRLPVTNKLGKTVYRKVRNQWNDRSIGVEIVAQNENSITSQQYASSLVLIETMKAMNPNMKYIKAHSELDPTRRSDPGNRLMNWIRSRTSY